MRPRLTWFLAVPLAALGTLAGHSVGYRLASPDPHERAHVLAASGHGYLTYAPVAAALCVVLVALAFAGAVVEAFSSGERGGTRRRIASVAALAPFAFAVQELLERSLHQGHVHWAVLVSAPFLLGLAAQVPFALLAAAVAYALADAAERLAGLIRARLPRPRARRAAPRAHRSVDLPRLRTLALGFAGRGPPSPA